MTHKFNDSRILEYTAKQLYNLVLDVEKYNEFVPWCKKCKIISQNSEEIVADLYVKSGFISQNYRSSIKHDKLGDGYFIDVRQISGPFKYLHTSWNFKKVDKQSTEVNFIIEFEFASEIITALSGPVFNSTSHKMIGAFEKRAKEIYG